MLEVLKADVVEAFAAFEGTLANTFYVVCILQVFRTQAAAYHAVQIGAAHEGLILNVLHAGQRHIPEVGTAHESLGGNIFDVIATTEIFQLGATLEGRQTDGLGIGIYNLQIGAALEHAVANPGAACHSGVFKIRPALESSFGEGRVRGDIESLHLALQTIYCRHTDVLHVAAYNEGILCPSFHCIRDDTEFVLTVSLSNQPEALVECCAELAAGHDGTVGCQIPIATDVHAFCVIVDVAPVAFLHVLCIKVIIPVGLHQIGRYADDGFAVSPARAVGLGSKWVVPLVLTA